MENLESKINEEIKKRDSDGGSWSSSEYFHHAWDHLCLTMNADLDISSDDEVSINALIKILENLLGHVRICWEIEKRSHN